MARGSTSYNGVNVNVEEWESYPGGRELQHRFKATLQTHDALPILAATISRL